MVDGVPSPSGGVLPREGTLNRRGYSPSPSSLDSYLNEIARRTR